MKTSDPVEPTIFVTGADANYFGLLRGLIKSVLAHRPSPTYAMGCFDLGLTDEQRAWLTEAGVSVIIPKTELRHGVTEGLQGKLGYLARPFLRENFPGYKIYIWLDADTWLQNWDAIERLQAGVIAEGGAFVRENAEEYDFRPDLLGWRALNFRRGYGTAMGFRMLLAPHINNGVFGLHADAPHWAPWVRYYQMAIDKSGRYAPFDQFGLNVAVYRNKLPAHFLPPTCNWICDLKLPHWNNETGLFCRPRNHAEPISVMHLAGLAKSIVASAPCASGGVLVGGLRYDDERSLQPAAAGKAPPRAGGSGRPSLADGPEQ